RPFRLGLFLHRLGGLFLGLGLFVFRGFGLLFPLAYRGQLHRHDWLVAPAGLPKTAGKEARTGGSGQKEKMRQRASKLHVADSLRAGRKETEIRLSSYPTIGAK